MVRSILDSDDLTNRRENTGSPSSIESLVVRPNEKYLQFPLSSFSDREVGKVEIGFVGAAGGA